MVHLSGSQAAEGALHFFEGWIIFLACTVLLALEISILARYSGKTIFSVLRVPRGTSARTQAPAIGLWSYMPVVASSVVLFIAIMGAAWLSGRSEIIQDRPRFVAFPERLGSWQGHASLLDPNVERILVLDDYILSDYAGPDGNTVNLYVGYYGSQQASQQPHSPSDCIPSSGWRISKFDLTTVAANGVEFPANRVVIEKNSIKQLVYYWFNESGRNVSNEYLAKWYLHANALLINRTDGALVRFVTQIGNGQTERDADARLTTFIRDAMPTLSNFLPSQSTSHLGSAIYGLEAVKLR